MHQSETALKRAIEVNRGQHQVANLGRPPIKNAISRRRFSPQKHIQRIWEGNVRLRRPPRLCRGGRSVDFLVEHFTFLGVSFQYWMPIAIGTLALYVLWLSKSWPRD